MQLGVSSSRRRLLMQKSALKCITTLTIFPLLRSMKWIIVWNMVGMHFATGFTQIPSRFPYDPYVAENRNLQVYNMGAAQATMAIPISMSMPAPGNLGQVPSTSLALSKTKSKSETQKEFLEKIFRENGIDSYLYKPNKGDRKKHGNRLELVGASSKVAQVKMGIVEDAKSPAFHMSYGTSSTSKNGVSSPVAFKPSPYQPTSTMDSSPAAGNGTEESGWIGLLAPTFRTAQKKTFPTRQKTKAQIQTAKEKKQGRSYKHAKKASKARPKQTSSKRSKSKKKALKANKIKIHQMTRPGTVAVKVSTNELTNSTKVNTTTTAETKPKTNTKSSKKSEPKTPTINDDSNNKRIFLNNSDSGKYHAVVQTPKAKQSLIKSQVAKLARKRTKTYRSKLNYTEVDLSKYPKLKAVDEILNTSNSKSVETTEKTESNSRPKWNISYNTAPTVKPKKEKSGPIPITMPIITPIQDPSKSFFPQSSTINSQFYPLQRPSATSLYEDRRPPPRLYSASPQFYNPTANSYLTTPLRPTVRSLTTNPSFSQFSVNVNNPQHSYPQSWSVGHGHRGRYLAPVPTMPARPIARKPRPMLFGRFRPPMPTRHNWYGRPPPQFFNSQFSARTGVSMVSDEVTGRKANSKRSKSKLKNISPTLKSLERSLDKVASTARSWFHFKLPDEIEPTEEPLTFPIVDPQHPVVQNALHPLGNPARQPEQYIEKKKKVIDPASLVPLDKTLVVFTILFGWLVILAGLVSYNAWGKKASVESIGTEDLDKAGLQLQPLLLNIPQDGSEPFITSRALDLTPDGRWNFSKVLEYIDIAQKLYTGFDWQHLECQKRTLCELSRKDTWTETGRKITNNYILSLVDALEGIPIPRMIQAYLQEYKEAISQGKVSNKSCGDLYKKCKFSIKEIIDGVKKKHM